METVETVETVEALGAEGVSGANVGAAEGSAADDTGGRDDPGTTSGVGG